VSRQDTPLESILIEKLRTEGSKNAFSAIFISYYKDLVLYAVNFTHDQDSAEEIVQDVFVRIWEDREILNIDISLKAYLLKSVRNKCIDWSRHADVRKKYHEENSRATLLCDNNTDHYILNSEIESLLKSALKKLPHEVEQVYRMSRFEGLKYHEIAERLQLSVRTIEDRMVKAFCVIRDELKDYLC
jgi:RNA polymerase sigma-70 factor (family 1)